MKWPWEGETPEFLYMELCECGHIWDVHVHAGDGFMVGCDECDLCEGFEGTGRYGTLHFGLGHWVDGDWRYDDAWERYKRDRFRYRFPGMAR